MDPRLRMEVGNFNAAMRDMSKRLEGSTAMRWIVDEEVGKILEATLAKTDAATVQSIRASFDSTQWTTLQGKKYKLSNRYPNPLWRTISEKRRSSLQRKLAARGLAKQSVQALAELMGVKINAPGYVSAAQTPKHTNAENVAVRRDFKPNAYGIEVSDRSPLLRWTGARAAFFAAVVGRRKFYEQNLRRGVFGDINQVIAKYPGMRMSGL